VVSACVSTTPEPAEQKSAEQEPATGQVPSVSQEATETESSDDQTLSNLPAQPTLNEQAAAEALRQRAEALAEEARLAAIAEEAAAIANLCRAIGNKLGSVSVADCTREQLIHGGYSTNGFSLAYREYSPLGNRKPLGKVLVLGGIHGDEFSSVSVVFKWMKKLDQFHSGLFHWRIVPSVNPDGLLQRRSQRQNANGVDLNRNFPTSDWTADALEYWASETGRNPRRNPGPYAASEIETRWVMAQIDAFQPDVIISMHAPYHLVDYDGPPQAPENLGSLYLRKLGVYPGSLGNYVGVDMQKPIVTVELKSAGIMPRQTEIDSMWNDLVSWLRGQLEPTGIARN
jgi:hypothetical protein